MFALSGVSAARRASTEAAKQRRYNPARLGQENGKTIAARYVMESRSLPAEFRRA
jgi:hypothetical protein